MRAQPKPTRERNAAHLAFIRKLPCIACAVEGPISAPRSVDAAHVSFLGIKGFGSKVSDLLTVPLCREHHDEQHRTGNERVWWARLGVNPRSLCEELQRWSLLPFNGREVIHDFAERARRMPKLIPAVELGQPADPLPARVTIAAHLSGGPADENGNVAVILPTTTGSAIAHVAPDALEVVR